MIFLFIATRFLESVFNLIICGRLGSFRICFLLSLLFLDEKLFLGNFQIVAKGTFLELASLNVLNQLNLGYSCLVIFDVLHESEKHARAETFL